MYVVMLSSTDVMPSCISSCSTGELSNATIAAGHCYAHGACVADGEFSDAHFPAMSCLRCDAATDQLALSAPDTTNHCYFGRTSTDDARISSHGAWCNFFDLSEIDTVRL